MRDQAAINMTAIEYIDFPSELASQYFGDQDARRAMLDPT